MPSEKERNTSKHKRKHKKMRKFESRAFAHAGALLVSLAKKTGLALFNVACYTGTTLHFNFTTEFI